MSEAYAGGCACGAIRYEISDEPIFSNDCQCRDCQRKSGTGTDPTSPSEQGESEGQRRGHALGHGWRQRQHKTRGFCPTCGSPVYLTFSANPNLFTIHAASLDDPGRYEPQAVTYTIVVTRGTTSTRPYRNSTRCQPAKFYSKRDVLRKGMSK